MEAEIVTFPYTRSPSLLSKGPGGYTLTPDMNQDQENSAIIDKILSGARWSIMIRTVAQIINWAVTIIVVRFISSSDYGLNAMLETPLEILFLISTFGLDVALVRLKAINMDQLRTAFGWLLFINGMLFLAYFLGSALIAEYFNEPRLAPLAQVLAFVFLLVPFRVIPNALLDRELKFKLKAFAELTSSITAAITTLSLAIMGAGVWALIIGLLTNRLLLAIILMALQPWFLTPSLDVTKAREMIAFGGTMTLAGAVATTGYMLPVIVAGPELGSEALGIFVISLQFALLPLAKIMPVVNPIIFPAFSKFQGQPKAVASYMEKSIGIAALVLLPPLIGLACIAEEFVVTIMGEKWLPAILPLALLSLCIPFRGLTSFIRQVIGGVGYANLALKSSIIFWVIFFALIVASKSFGLMGLVIALLITEPIVTLVTIHISKQAITTSYKGIVSSLFPALVCTAIMAAAVLCIKFFLTKQLGFVRLISEIIVGLIIYFAALRVLFPVRLNSAIKLLRAR